MRFGGKVQHAPRKKTRGVRGELKNVVYCVWIQTLHAARGPGVVSWGLVATGVFTRGPPVGLVLGFGSVPPPQAVRNGKILRVVSLAALERGG